MPMAAHKAMVGVTYSHRQIRVNFLGQFVLLTLIAIDVNHSAMHFRA